MYFDKCSILSQKKDILLAPSLKVNTVEDWPQGGDLVSTMPVCVSKSEGYGSLFGFK